MARAPSPHRASPNGSVIAVRGARKHNLKDVDIDIPKGCFVVFSGVSGSGKSTLAFDTLYAEGQRRYVESLSSYARQFLGMTKKAECDSIEGLSPAISIDQKQRSHNPRSTVATVTEIMDHLRLLWARIGLPHCPECGREVARRTVQEIVDDILWQMDGVSVSIWAPVITNRKGTHADLLRQLHESGYVTAKINGRPSDLEHPPILEKNLRHDIEVRMDRFRIQKSERQRLTEAVEDGLRLGNSLITVEEDESGQEFPFSEEFACPEHGAFITEMSPRVFSFNSPIGACPQCQGLGVMREFSEDLLINSERSIEEGAVVPFASSMMSGWYRSILIAVAEHYGFATDTPFSELDDDAKDLVLHGTGSTPIRVEMTSESGSQYVTNRPWEGVVPRVRRMLTDTSSNRTQSRLVSYMIEQPCSECDGNRLNKASSAVIVGTTTLPQINAMTIEQATTTVHGWMEGDKRLDERSLYIGRDILREVRNRLGFLDAVGLGYLTLDRRANTLSGGESQRIRLATQIGSRLTGVMYVLDEPSIGLHPHDNARLLSTLRELTELGNTLIVVEHDEATLRQADWIIDIGPKAGRDGGHIVAAGPPNHIIQAKASITGAFLSGREEIPIPSERKVIDDGRKLIIRGASQNNLKSVTASFPLGAMIAVTGVSGSGKSSLLTNTLAPALQRHLHGADVVPGPYSSIEGIEFVDKTIVIDQSPIGRTPRSNPATYTGVFDEIRKLYSSTKLSKERGYLQGRFSFNVRGGRCEACQGGGQIRLEMNFLPDVWITCEQCKGMRYNRETLEVRWRGKNIHDILQMTVSEAADFFQNHPKISRILHTLVDVGLGYITLGQPATTLSGGEAQRVKLSSELKRRAKKHTVYILDEPTTGLSLFDVRQLIEVLHRIRDKGHTIIIIEHHLDVIKSADWIVDLGPGGGDSGGRIVAIGTPEEVSVIESSRTGSALNPMLDGDKTVKQIA